MKSAISEVSGNVHFNVAQDLPNRLQICIIVYFMHYVFLRFFRRDVLEGEMLRNADKISSKVNVKMAKNNLGNLEKFGGIIKISSKKLDFLWG